MGADLYIESVYDKDKTGDAGYFRDSYNGTSLFSMLGLSWWRDVHTEDGYLPIREIQRMREEIEARPMDVALENLLGRGCTVDEGENSVEAWRKFFDDKRRRLLDFFDKALELREPIRASL